MHELQYGPLLQEWVDIKGYEGYYQISNYGQVKSLDRHIDNLGTKGDKGRVHIKEKILSVKLSKWGYPTTSLNKFGVVKKFLIHQLMAIAFCNHTPNRHKGLIVDHKNNIPSDNFLRNLQLITCRENTSKDKKGTSKYTGVSWNKAKRKWVAFIRIVKGKKTYLGSFHDEYDAHLAYEEALSNHLKQIA